MNKDNMPRWENGFKSSDWDFYLPERKRWFNTIDDSVMKLATRHCRESWQLTQPTCKEMLRGAMHPDLIYHASIADEVYKKAKEILDKPKIRLAQH